LTSQYNYFYNAIKKIYRNLETVIISVGFQVSPSPLAGRLCRKGKNREKCHDELVSASNRIQYLRDPEINSG
jgi:hypothetical protein